MEMAYIVHNVLLYIIRLQQYRIGMLNKTPMRWYWPNKIWPNYSLELYYFQMKTIFKMHFSLLKYIAKQSV